MASQGLGRWFEATFGTLVCDCFIVETGAKPREIVIGFEGEEPDGLAELVAEHPGEVILVRAKGFEALNYATELLVILGPAVIVQLGSIIKAHLNTSRQVRIKVGGVEIEGVTADKAMEMLEEIQAGQTHGS